MKDALGYEKKNQPTTDNIQTIASPCFLFKIQVQLIVHLYFCSTAENWQRNYCNHISGQWKWRSVINSEECGVLYPACDERIVNRAV